LKLTLSHTTLPEDVADNLEKLVDGASIDKLEAMLRKIKTHFGQRYVGYYFEYFKVTFFSIKTGYNYSIIM